MKGISKMEDNISKRNLEIALHFLRRGDTNATETMLESFLEHKEKEAEKAKARREAEDRRKETIVLEAFETAKKEDSIENLTLKQICYYINKYHLDTKAKKPWVPSKAAYPIERMRCAGKIELFFRESVRLCSPEGYYRTIKIKKFYLK